jgi:hypothetical protein
MGSGPGSSEEVWQRGTKMGCSTQVHGTKTRNLSVWLSLLKTSKNDMSFLLSLMFSLQ